MPSKIIRTAMFILLILLSSLFVIYTKGNGDVIIYSNPVPGENETGVIPVFNKGVKTQISINDTHGNNMVVRWYWNDSGTWKLYGVNLTVPNGTYSMWNANFSQFNHEYQWAVNTTDGTNYTNKTYSFTTIDDDVPWFIANEKSQNTIRLEWGESSQADKYCLRYDTAYHSTWTPTTGTLLANTTSLYYTHNGLSSGTNYYYALFVWNDTYGYSTDYQTDFTNTYYSDPNVIISNENPADDAKHIDITNNPPNPGGYTHLSVQLNDKDGGGDMEYWIDVYDFSTKSWVNRIHLIDQNNQTATQDETSFNTTDRFYFYRVSTKEGGQYNNRTYKFYTDKHPNKPYNPTPPNNGFDEHGNVTLKVYISHPDYDSGARIHNVSFFEYVTNRLIGWNYSASGFGNQTEVTCNTNLFCPESGQYYYWYAVAYDDEYNASSDIFKFQTYYNYTEPDTVYYTLDADIYVSQPLGTEPNTTYYTISAGIYVEPYYNDTEPDTVYYTIGSRIRVYYSPEMKYPNPANNSVNQPLCLPLELWLYKKGNVSDWLVKFYGNDTVDGRWEQQYHTQTVTLGHGVNALDLYEDFESGTFTDTMVDDDGDLTLAYDVEKTNTNWNSNWQYYQVFNINNPVNNYQMMINLSYTSKHMPSCFQHCKTDFSDIRFVDIDNSTVLPYWIEYKKDSDYAIIWVKTPSDATTDGKILMYYGNPSATDASDGNNTFVFFDDFDGSSLDTSKWDEDVGVHTSVSNSILELYEDTSNNDKIASKTSFSTPKVLRARVNLTDDVGSQIGFSTTFNGGNDDYKFVSQSSYSTYTFIARKDGTQNTYNTGKSKDDRFHTVNIFWNGTNGGNATIDGAYNVDISSTYTPTDNEKILIRQYNYPNKIYVDWVFVRNYTYPEPTFTQTTTYKSNGNHVSKEYNLSGRIKSTTISWNATTPSGTSITIQYSYNSGSGWSSWTTVSNGGFLPSFSDGDLVDGYKIRFREQLSTTDTSKTPEIHNLTLHIERYTKVRIPFCLLQYDRKYWWYVSLYNSSFTLTNSSIYNFKTKSYTDQEPDTVYYTLGSEISVAYNVMLSHPQPSDNSSGIPLDVQLTCWINKSGQPLTFDITFYANATVNESFVVVGELHGVTPNATVHVPFSMLQYNTTYWWYVHAVNTTTGMSDTSPVWKFTTKAYTDLEPDTVYYTLDAGIYVEPYYNDTEPDTVYYTIGAYAPVGIPFPPSDPYPPHNSSFGSQIFSQFSCYVEDIDNDTCTVKFYYASNDTVWYTATNVPSGSRAYAPKPHMVNYTWFEWYASVNDSGSQKEIKGPVWRYKPGNAEPNVSVYPDDGAVHIPVRRKSITGEWHYYVRLCADIDDQENDTMHITFYVDDPSLPGWNDWVMRQNNVNASDGIYLQDELWFNKTNTAYHWRLYVSDGHNSTNYYMNFTTGFIFYAYFNYTPHRPTNEDLVKLIDLSENATDMIWYVNGIKVATANYTSGNHTQFNITHKFNISNIYNVSLWIHNDSCGNVDVWNETIYVDRNATFNTTSGNAGINYDCYHLNTSINASTYAKLFNLSNGWWIHKYDTTNKTWHSYWIGMAGENFNISMWDSIAVTVDKDFKTRVNLTYPVNTKQILNIPQGYNYIVWSDINTTTSKNLSIGLQTGDWVFKYNTTSGTWYAYWYGMTGDDFIIKSYDTIVLNVASSRNIQIG